MKSVMTKPLAVAAAVVMLAVIAAAAPAHSAGKMFGVRPGETVQTAYFGYGSGAIVPLAGIDFLSLSASIEDYNVSASLYVPHFGIRVYLSPKNALGSVRPYVEGSFLYSFPSVNLGAALGDSSSIQDMVKDVLSFWGVTGIFGCEYYFSERFSVAGEYGLRYIRDSAKLNISGGSILSSDINSELKVSYKHSYTAAALNFHF